jgi:metal-responsive CopG/Arc/MetJ family transcriptional regulator
LPNPYGRPSPDKPKNIQLRIMLDLELSNQLNKYCYKNKISNKSDFIRDLIAKATKDAK